MGRPCGVPGGPGIARGRRFLLNAHYSPQIHAGLSKSMRASWAGRGRRAVCMCLWDHSRCGWFCVCRPTETNFRPGFGISSGERRGGPGIARGRRDLSNAVGREEIHAGLSKSMRASWAGRGRAPSGVYVALGTLSVCVVLRVRANRNDTSDPGLGSAAESTLSGMGRP